jgi:hypothetical protein
MRIADIKLGALLPVPCANIAILRMSSPMSRLLVLAGLHVFLVHERVFASDWKSAIRAYPREPKNQSARRRRRAGWQNSWEGVRGSHEHTRERQRR